MFMRQPRSPASRVGAPVSLDVLGLGVDDGAGDVAVLDREGAAEAAAHVAVLHLDEGQALHAGEQLARLGPDAELAQARAGIVIGDGAVEGGLDLGDAEHVDQEARELVGLGRQRIGLGSQFGSSSKSSG